eukprot:3655818-Rhodomonas_salina.4
MRVPVYAQKARIVEAPGTPGTRVPWYPGSLPVLSEGRNAPAEMHTRRVRAYPGYPGMGMGMQTGRAGTRIPQLVPGYPGTLGTESRDTEPDETLTHYRVPG